MQLHKFLVRLLAAVVLGAVVCLGMAAVFRPMRTVTEDAASRTMLAAPLQSIGSLRISNECGFELWIEQQGLPGAPTLSPLAEDAHVDYAIPAAGAPATRFWAKAECSDAGQACKMGQSSAPCPAGGCTPPVDSKLEATWPCLLDAGCAVNPVDKKPLTNVLWWNASLVDGFTLPFVVRVTGVEAESCQPADCSKLLAKDCPTDDDLSDNGKNPAYKNEDEKLQGAIGCFAPYMKLGYPGYGGHGLNAPAGPVEKMYACPTPPVSAEDCRGGPVTKTKYVELIHRACEETVYSYAYDDAVGLRSCPGGTSLELVYCPKETR
jgi:Thaumatin family